MANYCDVSTRFPLNEIPPLLNQREQLIAQYEKKAAEDLIQATFKEVDGTVWVCPYSDIKVPLGGYSYTTLDPIKSYKYSFPWWVQVGFAGAKRIGNNPGWAPYLAWELPVRTVIKNLEYVQKVHESIPVDGALESWLWASSAINKVQEISEWFSLALRVSSHALAVLDWSEVTAYDPENTYEWEKNNQPNDLMADIKDLDKDIRSTVSGELSQAEFTANWAEVKE